jgi:hypothetical protein
MSIAADGWWVEPGIGETRAIRLSGGEIAEAIIERDRLTPVGTRLAARLARAGTRGALAAGSDGETYLLPRGSGRVREGQSLIIEVWREPIVAEGWKRPLAHVVEDADPAQMSAPSSLSGRLGGQALAANAPRDLFAAAGWDALLAEAREGRVDFPGGELRLFATPAMTLVDVDGTLPGPALAMAAAGAAGRAIVRLGLAGSIGIDFPTLPDKAARVAAAAAFDEALAAAGGGAVERTQINGFGLMQVIRPRRRASLVELAQDRAGFEARALLRRAGRETGAVAIVAHPRVVVAIEAIDGWQDRLARLTGGAPGLRADPALAMQQGHVTRL